VLDNGDDLLKSSSKSDWRP